MTIKNLLIGLIAAVCYCGVLELCLPAELPVAPGPAVVVDYELPADFEAPADDCELRTDCVSL